MLTPSSIGIVESGEYLSQDFFSFVDLLAEDFNSPIKISGSWESDSSELEEVTRAVTKALFENFSSILRVTPAELLIFVDEILAKGYPKFDIPSGDQDSNGVGSQRSSSPRKTKKIKKTSKKEIDLDDDIEDEDDLYDLQSYLPIDDDDIDDLLREISFRDNLFQAESLEDFLGFEIDITTQYRDSYESRHAGPMAFELSELLGHGVAVCWCGEEYERSEGCPENFY